MRKFVPFLLLPVAAVLAAGILAPKLASEERLRHEVETMVEAATGRKPAIAGPVSFSVLPWPAIEVEKLTIDGPRARLDVGEARVVLDVLPLLTGRARADHIELDDADLTLADPGDSLAALGVLIAGLGTTTSGADLFVKDGSVKITRAAGDEVLVPQADIRIGWRGGRDVTAVGRTVWRGEPVDVDLSLSGLAALAAGEAGNLRLSLSGAPAKLAFQGGARLAGGPVVTGALTASSTQLRDALEWLGFEAPTARGFGAFDLRAVALLSAQGAVLNEARIDLDGNSSVGAFNLRIDGSHAMLQGSLASEALDLSPYGEITLSGPHGASWNREAIDLNRTQRLDVDLRLSAGQVRIGEAALQRMAASATLKGGKLSLTIGEAEAWGGVFRASAHMAPLETGTGATVRIDLSADDVGLAKALGELFRLPRLEGTGSFRLSAAGSGDSVMEIVQKLNGAFTLTGEDGALVGIDVGRILARLEKRPLSGGGDLRGGRTPFDSIVVDASIEDGIARLDRIDLASAKLRVALAGESSIAQRALDFTGTAQLVRPASSEAARAAPSQGDPSKAAPPPAGAPIAAEPAATQSAPTKPAGTATASSVELANAATAAAAKAAVATVAFEVPFIVRGDWDRPIVLPDPQALIRRSGAARPLLRGSDALDVAAPLP